MIQKLKIAALLFFIYSSSVFTNETNSQFEYIDTLIKNQKYDIANTKLDDLLLKNPNDSDALMYKGVLIFYSESVNQTQIGVWQNIDSIYEPEYKEDAVENSVITPETANKISTYFLKAIKVDPAKMNVQLALCYAYAKAGMKSELISRLPDLKKYSSEKDKMQYNMAEYARILARQKSVEDGIDVYKEIIKLYPEDGNILNDIGVLYYEHGFIDNSMEYFNKAQTAGNLDKNTLENLLLIYSLTGEYNKLLSTAKILSSQEKDRNDVIYQALEQRLENKSEWVKTISYYVNQDDSKSNIDSFVNTLQKSMLTDNYSKFLETTRYNVPAPMLALNYEWALKNYPDKFVNLFNYAEFLTYYHHYSKAIEIYKSILLQNIVMDDEQKEEFNFYYAWALHKSGQDLQSQQYWKKLINSKNFYKKSAASYFLGKYYFEKKDFSSARKYFSFVKDNPEKSKYAEFCLGMFNQMAK
ncbi:MAG: tetratricopeptide repeat protein [Spirochaetia bacterium]|nr:tetratricopeptide repeat protein [Spirochaetia bacterium]